MSNTAKAQDMSEGFPPPATAQKRGGLQSGFPPAAPIKQAIVDNKPIPVSSAVTHEPLRLTPDRSEILVLEQEAARVVLGNERHLNIFVDSANRLVLVPRLPGSTFFTVLNEDGEVIMQRHAIIGSPKKNYIRVRRSCSLDDGAECVDTQVFYCPDMCHEISVDTPESATSGGQQASSMPSDGGNGQQSPPPVFGEPPEMDGQ